MDGTEGDDDDCKYHVSYTTAPLCENDGIYFVVTASYLTRSGAPLTGACASAELCLSDTHPAPVADGRPPRGTAGGRRAAGHVHDWAGRLRRRGGVDGSIPLQRVLL